MTTSAVLLTPDRPVLRYHGGKFRLAPWILAHLPSHRVYVEPFCGAASILMQKLPSHVEIINDLDNRIVNLFRVLRNPSQSERLQELLLLTPYARAEYEAAFESSADPVEQARRTIVQAFMGFGAASMNTKHRSGFRVKWSGSYTASSNTWNRYPAALQDFTARLSGVTIESKPALDLIRQYNHPDVCIYADPPYVLETRNQKHASCRYQHDMTDADHRELAEALCDTRSKVVLSGYPSALYKELFPAPDWHCVTTTARIEHGQERTEALWLNRAACAHLQKALPL